MKCKNLVGFECKVVMAALHRDDLLNQTCEVLALTDRPNGVFTALVCMANGELVSLPATDLKRT